MIGTLTLAQAAAYLQIHEDTLQRRAAAGIIPGAKIGKRWVFLEADLAAYVQSQYRRSERCPSTAASPAARGTSTSGAAAAVALDALLARPTAKRRSASTTRLRLVCGNSAKRAGT